MTENDSADVANYNYYYIFETCVLEHIEHTWNKWSCSLVLYTNGFVSKLVKYSHSRHSYLSKDIRSAVRWDLFQWWQKIYELTLDTFCNCQRPVFSLINKMNNMRKIWPNCSYFLNTLMCVFRCNIKATRHD